MTTSYPVAQQRAYLSPVVAKLEGWEPVGNLLPHTWFQSPKLRFANGKTNYVAVFLFAEVAYWHRPAYIYDPSTRKAIGMRNKFEGAKFRVDYEKLAEKFGSTERAMRDAATFLVERSLIEREVVNKVKTTNGNVSGVVYLTPVVDALIALSKLPPRAQNGGFGDMDDTTGGGFGDEYEVVELDDNEGRHPHVETGVGSHFNVSEVAAEREGGRAGTSALRETNTDEISYKNTPDLADTKVYATTRILGATAKEQLAADVYRNKKQLTPEKSALIHSLAESVVSMKMGVDMHDALEIVEEAFKSDCLQSPAKARIERAVRHFPSSVRSKNLKNPGGAFRVYVRGDKARLIDDINFAHDKERENSQQKVKFAGVSPALSSVFAATQAAKGEAAVMQAVRSLKTYDETPAHLVAERDGERTEINDGENDYDLDADKETPAPRTARPVVVKQAARTPIFRPRSVDAPLALATHDLTCQKVWDTLSQCARLRVHKQTIKDVLEFAPANTHEISQVAIDFCDDMTKDARTLNKFERQVFFTRRSVLRKMAESPMSANGKTYYDEIDARNARIDADFEPTPASYVAADGLPFPDPFADDAEGGK